MCLNRDLRDYGITVMEEFGIVFNRVNPLF